MNIQYNPHFQGIFDTKKFYIVAWGGGGSGKSYSIQQKIVYRALSEDKEAHKFLALRKFKTTIDHSIWDLFIHIIDLWGVRSRVSINNTKHEINFDNGNVIICSGLDEPEKLKSIFNVACIFFEEATDFDEEDLNQAVARLRGDSKYYKQIILAFNPISETHWLKKNLIDKQTKDMFVIWSNYKHNIFRGEGYEDRMKERYSTNENMYRIMVDGEWGRMVTGLEFYPRFNYKLHVMERDIIPNMPLHISFDFNRLPYLSISIWQVIKIDNIYHVNNIDEMALKPPDNETEYACKAFLDKYEMFLENHNQILYIYGDASGRQKRTESHYHNYDIIEKELQRYLRNYSWRVPASNPPVGQRKDFINRILAGGYPDINLAINPNNMFMIDDLQGVLEDVTMGDVPSVRKYKKRAKDQVTGLIFEELGHFSDTFDYFICELFIKYFEDYTYSMKML